MFDKGQKQSSTLSCDSSYYYFRSQFELSHFSVILTMKVNGQGVPCVRNSSYSFILILLKLYSCLYNALKICMWLGCTPQINFCHFFRNLNLVIFGAFTLGKFMWLLRLYLCN